ncbi:putative Pfs77 [Gregarina niphandrodes]|uniref:Pfs77 n=1 Tax=Gregarina niphandrodes TaxID=110365 RepID=A0A023B4Q1_GRENI|nr:putative Pfs77 [Gregarina niphandrodes]EZG57174.1 putative Pfs77 [Gregarina niphandrodes]|eukprot:XP_011131079.1 putative Pfs77 [Gregarina niphandrodes]
MTAGKTPMTEGSRVDVTEAVLGVDGESADVQTIGEDASAGGLFAGCCPGGRLSEAQEHVMRLTYPDAPYTNYTPIPGVIPPVAPPEYRTSGWCNADNGSCVIQATQPVIPVPVKQNIVMKDTLVEVDQTVVKDKVQPNIWTQEVFHEVPRLEFEVRERRVAIPKLEIVGVEQEVEVPVGINFKLQHTWEEREVPRLFPRYCGPQDVIQVSIPQIQVVDRKTEHEIPWYVGEKVVEKEVVEDEGVEIVSYQYVKKEEVVPVYKYRPVFDVEVAIPPPVVVPIPVAPQEVNSGQQKVSWEEYQRQRREKKKNALCKEACKPLTCTDTIICGRRVDCCPVGCCRVGCCGICNDCCANTTQQHLTANPTLQPGKQAGTPPRAEEDDDNDSL